MQPSNQHDGKSVLSCQPDDRLPAASRRQMIIGAIARPGKTSKEEEKQIQGKRIVVGAFAHRGQQESSAKQNKRFTRLGRRLSLRLFRQDACNHRGWGRMPCSITIRPSDHGLVYQQALNMLYLPLAASPRIAAPSSEPHNSRVKLDRGASGSLEPAYKLRSRTWKPKPPRRDLLKSTGSSFLGVSLAFFGSGSRGANLAQVRRKPLRRRAWKWNPTVLRFLIVARFYMPGNGQNRTVFHGQGQLRKQKVD